MPRPRSYSRNVVEIIGERVVADMTTEEIVAVNDDGVAFHFKLFEDFQPVCAGRYLYNGARYAAPFQEYKLYQAVVSLRDQDWVKTVRFMVKGGKLHILGPD